ncbi:MAG: hypothetical protein A4E53_03358 [Pelotomaculum sp. PtaB.Bin104]|nr:MAG: hypothetical protein A4E53_03358 [Pelotomaculum sp. PtaB.Bin104]
MRRGVKKRFLLVFVISILVTIYAAPVLASSEEIRITVDDRAINFNDPPVLKNGRVLVSGKNLCPVLEAQYHWEPNTDWVSGDQDSHWG